MRWIFSCFSWLRLYYSLIKDFDIAVISTSYPKKFLSPQKSKSIADIGDAKKLWKNKGDSDDDYKALLEYASQYAEVYMLEDSLWYKVDNIALQLPKNTISPSKVTSQKSVPVWPKPTT